MSDNWGPVRQDMQIVHPDSSDAHVVMPTCDDPANEYKYDATDSRTNMSHADKWVKVDHCSGPASMDGCATSRFEDGPGPWKQT